MNARLVLHRKRKRVWAAQLRSPQATLGRGRGCTVRIPSGEVSRMHCRLHLEDGLVRVEDLESANGTFVNGTQIHGTEIVRPGDRLSLGPVTFVVEYEMTPEALRRLDSGDDYEVVEADDVELVEDASTQPTKPSPAMVEDVEEAQETGEELSILEEPEEMHLPDGGDLRDFLIELDDTDEPAK